MNELMIEAENLTKYYGDYLAVESLNFQVRKGEIVGFLGPNGSGKTTTMRMLTGYMPPSSGTAKIAGYNSLSESLDARRQIGYLPETVPLYVDMPVAEYLQFMGSLRQMDKNRLRRRIDEVIQIVRIEEYRYTLIGKLSKGYRQRVGLAQAIIHEPEVLILDEPTIGIDPIQVVETRELIKELGRDHTVLLSTHILPEVSMLCQKVFIINEGLLVAEGSQADLAQRLQLSDRVEADIKGPQGEIASALGKIQGVIDVNVRHTGEEQLFTVESQPNSQHGEAIAKVVVEKGWGLRRLTPISMGLEEVFLRLTASQEEP
jgi:ABC-2 type transport system ATP-binding protein